MMSQCLKQCSSIPLSLRGPCSSVAPETVWRYECHHEKLRTLFVLHSRSQFVFFAMVCNTCNCLFGWIFVVYCCRLD